MNSKYLFFHTPYHSPSDSNYAHCMIALAEGMQQLGVVFYGNIDYWLLQGNQYLIEKQPIGYVADVHIYSSNFALEHFNKLDTIIDHKKINVLIDSSTFPWLEAFGINNSSEELERIYKHKFFSMFDLVLRNHCVKDFGYRPNVVPWVFGLTNRIIEETQKTINIPMQPSIVSNFRINLDVRKLALNKLDPILGKRFDINTNVTETLDMDDNQIPFKDEFEKLNWQQSGRRHRASYFEALNKSLLTYTFGGLIDIKSMTNGRHVNLLRMRNRVQKNLLQLLSMDYSSNIVIYQFDNWRIWESLVSNSCPINMDFGDWGMLLPVLPINGEHYWGVKKLKFTESANELMTLTDEEINEIGAAGREWVMKHYAPVPTTLRFIELINGL